MTKISYESHFKSKRKDGRFVTSFAAFSEKMRNISPRLSLPKSLSLEGYNKWQNEVRAKYRELLRIPPVTLQEPPVLLKTEKREGYWAEKWEFYPDEYTAVPFIVLIPDEASSDNRVPGVLCLPGSFHSKEFISGEPLLEPQNCRFVKYPERNEMALYMVRNGMCAFVFDNIATAETGIATEDNADNWNCYSREHMVYGYLQSGICYPGMSVYNMLSFLQYIDSFDFVDRDRLAVSAHSLGTEAAMSLGVLCGEIKAVIFNDFLCNGRVRFASNTEFEVGKMDHDIGFWHTVPGLWEYFDFPDLCAAIAPKYIAFNEGGADESFDTVKRAYSLLDAEDRLQITHYPKYRNEEDRIYHGEVPRHGLDSESFYAWNYCDPRDHSFREEPAIRLLKKAFFKQKNEEKLNGEI